jgi:hypothetical protein
MENANHECGSSCAALIPPSKVKNKSVYLTEKRLKFIQMRRLKKRLNLLRKTTRKFRKIKPRIARPSNGFLKSILSDNDDVIENANEHLAQEVAKNDSRLLNLVNESLLLPWEIRKTKSN